jgi:zinc D-Ala-D-Ala dipeptidase
MKPYQTIPIRECAEPLVPLPATFLRVLPHPYAKLGAPYGEASPFIVREGVLKRLLQAQDYLQSAQPGWQIQLFDGFRPLAVQQFMVEYTLQGLLAAAGVERTPATEAEFMPQVYQFWAVPSPNPHTPPPHSTGAAVDVTLVDASGNPVAMGSPIDEVSERSYPDYFAIRQPEIHEHRFLLNSVLHQAGFARHPNEWWHFSYGDQLWAWLTGVTTARYGRV